MKRIHPGLKTKRVREMFSTEEKQKLKESRQRREYLEQLAAIQTGKNIHVEFGDSAKADVTSRNSKLGHTDRLVITIPTDIADQPVTDLDDEVWDMLYQKMLLYHELGHVLYTDWPSFEANLVQRQHPLTEPYKYMWNILEDGAIERLLKQRFDIEDDLEALNRNLIENATPKNGAGFTYLRAIDWCLRGYVHDQSDVYEDLKAGRKGYSFNSPDDDHLMVDCAEPIIDDYADAIMQTDAPTERNRLYDQFFDEIADIYEDDTDVNVQMHEVPDIMPDDADENDGTEGKPADVEEDDNDSDEEEAVVDDYEKFELSLQREYQKNMERFTDEDGESKATDIEEWVRVTDTDYDLNTLYGIEVPQSGRSADKKTKMEAEQVSRPIATEFEQRLKQEQRSRRQKGKRSGKLNTGSLHKTRQGDTKIFEQSTDPDEKDYSACVILDRSGSMRDMMSDAEVAAGALIYALDDVGIDALQLSISSASGTVLEKTVNQDVEDASDAMFCGKAGGGTPMTDGLILAKERLEDLGGNPFVIIVHDGHPDHQERYRDILEECNFPVLGVYLDEAGNFGEHHINDSSYFHKLTMEHKDNAAQAVKQMAKGVMF